MNLAKIARENGIHKDTVYSRYTKMRNSGAPIDLAALTKKVRYRNGKKPKLYGGKTINGWVDYYAFWGVGPGMRTVRTHWNKWLSKGLDEATIVSKQKKLWVKNAR
jgi:hypothetical protein